MKYKKTKTTRRVGSYAKKTYKAGKAKKYPRWRLDVRLLDWLNDRLYAEAKKMGIEE